MAALDRDMRMAEIGALYEVVPMTDWQRARQLWFLTRDGGVRVTSIEVFEMPPAPRPHFGSGGGPVGAGIPIVRQEMQRVGRRRG